MWAVADEPEDLDEFVRKHRPRILSFTTFSTGDTDLAVSITHDCLLKAYRARATFTGRSTVNTWLTSIALNLIRDHYRSKKIQFWKKAEKSALDIHEVTSLVPAQQTSQETRMLAQERVKQVYAVVESLSLNQRTAFLMRFTQEMEMQEIADAMGMPINTVKTHLHRALHAVRGGVSKLDTPFPNLHSAMVR